MSEEIIRELWDFRQMEIPEKLLELKVSQAAVEGRLAAAAERFLTIEPVSDGIRQGDIVALETADGASRLQINVGLDFAGEALENRLLGLRVGAEASPEDWTSPGRVASVKRRMIPVLTDALVSRLGIEGVSTVEQYRAYVQEQEARRVQRGKTQALCEFVTKAVLKRSTFAEIGEDSEDYRLLYRGVAAQLDAMEGSREENLARMLHLADQSGEACWEALRSQCADMVKRTALGRAYADRDGVSFTREDVLRQYQDAGMQPPGEDDLAAGCMNLYIQYFHQKVAGYYSGRFHTVLVP